MTHSIIEWANKILRRCAAALCIHCLSRKVTTVFKKKTNKAVIYLFDYISEEEKTPLCPRKYCRR